MTTLLSALWRSPAARLLVPIAIGSTLLSCTPSKVSQCNKLADAVNKMRPIAEQFQQENKTFDAAAKAASAKNDFNGVKAAAANAATAFTGLTTRLDGLVQEIQGTNLQDETLVGLKNRYVENATAINDSFKGITNVLITISKLENSPKGLQDLSRAGRGLSQTASTMGRLIQAETLLVSDFNKYCEVNK